MNRRFKVELNNADDDVKSNEFEKDLSMLNVRGSPWILTRSTYLSFRMSALYLKGLLFQ